MSYWLIVYLNSDTNHKPVWYSLNIHNLNYCEIISRYLCEGKLGASSPGSLLSKSLEAKLNRKTARKDEFLSQVRDLIGI